MPTLFTRIMLALLVAAPLSAAAADSTPATPPANPAASAAAPAIPPLVVTPENKPFTLTSERRGAMIGYVDVIRIGAESERGKALKTVLTSKKDSLQKKVEARKKQLDKLKTSIETKMSGMTQPERETKYKEFQKKLEEFQKFAQTSEEEYYKLQEKETRQLYELVEQAAASHGQANGFDVIVVKKELLYIGSGADTRDVTEAIIKAVDESGRKK